MAIIILALLFGIVVLALVLRSLTKNSGMSDNILYKILKILLLVETAAFVVIFVIVLIKTIMT